MHILAPVRGTTYRIADNPEVEDVVLNLHADEAVELEREPTNRFDPNAVKVLTTNGTFIGYVGREFAAQIAPSLDQELEYSAKVVHFAKVLEPILEIEIEDPLFDESTAA